jgi:hypothetical protein
MSINDQWIDWLSSKWFSNFYHEYSLPRGIKWECSSLKNAYEKYTWKNKNFGCTEILLSQHSRDLALNLEYDDNTSTFNTCMDILRWGGVISNTKKGERPTVSWLRDSFEKEALCSTIKNGLKALNSHRYSEFDGINLLMDSAATKIFSLADKEQRIIIYDGRVGAALGLLAKQFLKAEGIDELEPPFDFLWGGARSKNLNRNPSEGRFRFRGLWSVNERNLEHAKMVVRSSELVNELCIRTGARPREWEAALFMVGYHIPKVNL